MIYNEDCINGMKRLIQQGMKVDCIITDPPYLQNYKTGGRKNKNHRFCKPILNDKNQYGLIKEFIIASNSLLKEGGGDLLLL